LNLIHNKPEFRSRPPATRGVTLTELLVVISIIVLVTAMLVPMLAPVLRGQKIREATRQVNVFFSGAQARAVELGRPVGVWIERAEHGNGLTPRQFTAYKLYQAEQPPAYSGDIYDARVNLAPISPSNPNDWNAVYQPGCCSMLGPMVPNGEEMKYRVRFGGRGPTYEILRIDDTMGFTFRVAPNQFVRDVPNNAIEIPALKFRSSGNTVQYSAYANGVPFEIIGPPIKSATAALELPRNTGLDLSLSGYQWSNHQSLTRFREYLDYDILVMFDPRGGVSHVQYLPHEGIAPVPPVEQPLGMISLLLARDDKIGRDRQGNPNVPPNNYVTSALGEGSIGDPDSMWLWVDTRTGRIQSSPNVDPFGAFSSSQTLPVGTDIRNDWLPQAQTLIRSAIDQGGR